MRNRALVLMSLVLSSAYGYVTAYHVEPVKASWSGWTTLQNNSVSEVITCNFDEPIYAEYFTGTATGQQYQVQLLRFDDPPVVVAEGNAYENRSHVWVRCSLDVLRPDLVTKGKLYEVRWTLSSGPDSLMYYYDSTDCYKYGGMAVGSQVPIPNPNDLACRVYGRLDAIAADWWAVVPGCPWNHPEQLSTWRERMETLGVKRAGFIMYWDVIETTKGTFDFDSYYHHDTVAAWLHDSVGCALDARPVHCPAWASSRIEPQGETMSHYAPPLNLFHPVSDTGDTGSVNYWARFIRRTVQHYDAQGHPIHIWNIYNEPNDTTTDTSNHKTGWWRRPNVDTAYPGLDTGARPLCSLYVRLCSVAESVIHHGGLPGHAEDTILIGSTSCVRKADDGVVKGDTWIWMCYDIATRPGGPGIFWNGVAVHPYQWWDPEFDIDFYEGDARRAHQVMDTFERGGKVWNEEMGWWWSEGESLQARRLAKAFVATSGTEAIPEGGFEGMMWYTLKGDWGGLDDNQIVDGDTQMTPKPAFHAFAQLRRMLTGKRLNGRVIDGDTAVDNHVRMYEFEDPTSLKKTWVCWRSDGSSDDATVQLPARADSAYIEALAYEGGTPPNQMRQANSYGWLGIGATDRPQFVTEPANESISRPELVVDSFKAHPLPLRIGEPSSFSVFVRNSGEKGTPGTVQVNIYWNDSLLTTITCDTIPAGQSRYAGLVGFNIPQWVHGDGLLKAEVNPGQEYVEEIGTDDDCGYIRTSSFWPPIGDIGIACGVHSNAPLPLLAFESRSREADTTGQTPCDSARLVQWWYGLNDTVAHGGDTTAWFCANEEKRDTSMKSPLSSLEFDSPPESFRSVPV